MSADQEEIGVIGKAKQSLYHRGRPFDSPFASSGFAQGRLRSTEENREDPEIGTSRNRRIGTFRNRYIGGSDDRVISSGSPIFTG